MGFFEWDISCINDASQQAIIRLQQLNWLLLLLYILRHQKRKAEFDIFLSKGFEKGSSKDPIKLSGVMCESILIGTASYLPGTSVTLVSRKGLLLNSHHSLTTALTLGNMLYVYQA